MIWKRNVDTESFSKFIIYERWEMFYPRIIADRLQDIKDTSTGYILTVI